MTYTNEQKKRILDYADANSMNKAVKKYGVSVASIRTWRKRMNGHEAAAPIRDHILEQLRAENSAMKKIIVEKILKEYGITL